MRALVTGADGFVGQWLLRRLLTDGVSVTGMIRATAPSLTTLEPELAARISWQHGEITDGSRMREIVAAVQPVTVFHLAAQSSVPASIADPLTTIETNVMGTARLLEAVRIAAPAVTVIVVGSSDAYGAVTQAQLPLREDMPLQPRNPYAASKAAAEIIALQAARSGTVRVIATRSFNHTGPGQSPSFAVASFAKQIAALTRGDGAREIHVGNLQPRRDLSDVRDVVDAYIRLAAAGTVGAVYNVCSGKDMSMRDIVVELVRISGVSAEIREDPALVRVVETPVLRGDPSRIAADTGWKATTPLQTTLADLLEYYARGAA